MTEGPCKYYCNKENIGSVNDSFASKLHLKKCLKETKKFSNFLAEWGSKIVTNEARIDESEMDFYQQCENVRQLLNR